MDVKKLFGREVDSCRTCKHYDKENGVCIETGLVIGDKVSICKHWKYKKPEHLMINKEAE